MKTFIIDKEIELFSFLKQNIKGSKNNIKSLLVNKRVLVNRKVITKYNFLLKENDKVEIGNTNIENVYVSNLKIIYEDDYLIVVDKPSGILTIGTEREKEKTLYNIVSKYVKNKNKYNKIFVVHRLDKDTSGVVVFAKNEKIKKILQDNWNNITTRIYHAIVIGNTKDNERLVSYLKENKNLYTYSSSDGLLAITNYKKIISNRKYSLLEIIIETGRKNQIRVQLNDIGHPILGDKKYGNNKYDRLMLHASKLVIKCASYNMDFVFESQVPNSFKKIINC